jgi:hypothetical protein
MIDVVILGQRVDGDVGALGFDTLSPTHAGAVGVGNGYIGGHPAGISTGGFMCGSGVTDANYVGVFYNNALIDTNVGAQQVGTSVDMTEAEPGVVWRGGFKARLYKGRRHNVTDSHAPFTSGVTWAVGNNLYLSATGDWTNATSSGRTTVWGKVLEAPANEDATLEAQFL